MILGQAVDLAVRLRSMQQNKDKRSSWYPGSSERQDRPAILSLLFPGGSCDPTADDSLPALAIVIQPGVPNLSF